MTKEQATSVKSVLISCFCPTNCLKTLCVYNHATSKCKRSDLWSASIFSHKSSSKRELSGWAFTNFTTFTTSWTTTHFRFKVTHCLSLCQWYEAQSSCEKHFAILHHESLSCVLSELLLCMYRCRCSLLKKYLRLWNNQPFIALNVSLPVHFSESGRQNKNSSWMFSLKEYLMNTSSWANLATSIDLLIWRGNF
jgi:hypothetical protein